MKQYLNSSLTVEKAKERIKSEVKHMKIKEISENGKGQIVIKTNWFNYKVTFIKETDKTIFKLGGFGNIKLILLSLSGLFLIFPIPFVFYISYGESRFQKELKGKISELLH